MEVVMAAVTVLIALQAWTLKQLMDLKIKVAVIHSACRRCPENTNED